MDKGPKHIYIKTTPDIKDAAGNSRKKDGRTLSNYIESLLIERIQKDKK